MGEIEIFKFEYPLFALLLVVPLLVNLILREKIHFTISDKYQLMMPYINRLKDAFCGLGQNNIRKNRNNFILYYLLWICLILALMQPVLLNKTANRQHLGYDIMLGVDLSESMTSADFRLNGKPVDRLTITKNVVDKFVSERKDDRIGLVVFSDHAYLHVPLTTDTNSVAKMLNKLQVGMAGRATAIGDAIAVAVKNLKDRDTNSKIFILLTDGKNTAGAIDPIVAANLAKDHNVKIYVIGVGSKKSLLVDNFFGSIVTNSSPIDESLLKEISSITGGKYYHAGKSEALYEVYQTIDKLEKTKIESKEYIIKDPLYRIPLSVACLILLIITIKPLFTRVGAYGF